MATIIRMRRRRAIIVGLFLLFQAYFFHKQVETVPFFLYGMYSGFAADRHAQPQQRVYGVFWENEKGERQKLDLLRLPQVKRDFLLQSIHVWEGIKYLGWQAMRADLRQTIHSRFASFLSAGGLAYCEGALLGAELTEENMQAWLQRFLATTRPRAGENWRIRLIAYDFWTQEARAAEVAVLL